MAMTDEEILSAAARIRAARRRRVAKTCEVCGAPFLGVAQRRYCSDGCRVKASRQRRGAPAAPQYLALAEHLGCELWTADGDSGVEESSEIDRDFR